jgi:hypothetical protein
LEIRQVRQNKKLRLGANTNCALRTLRRILHKAEESDRIYDLSGPQRIELGTYRARIDRRYNRVQFLLQDKNGKQPGTFTTERQHSL